MSKKAIEVAARYRRKYWREIDLEDLERYRVDAFAFPNYPVITDKEEIQIYNWGLIPHWVKDTVQANTIRKGTVNAMSETVFEKPSFRSSILSKRCIIPSTGFFDWRHEEDNKIPYFIYLKEQEIFSMGGIYSEWADPKTGEIYNTFSILTTVANPLMEYIHNTKKRMPVILSPESEENWLNSRLNRGDIQSFFRPFDSDRMDAYIINRDFLKKSPHDASIIERIAG